MTYRDKLNRASVALAELQKSKRCSLWPDCGCKAQLVHWQERVCDHDEEWEFESIRWAETSIFITLSCLADRCPDRRIRNYANCQLLSPWWDRQRRGEEITRAFIERLREEANGRRLA
jgi:hypothetical protein